METQNVTDQVLRDHRLAAANDPTFLGGPEPPTTGVAHEQPEGLASASATALEAATEVAVEAPIDLPFRAAAARGLARVVGAVPEVPGGMKDVLSARAEHCSEDSGAPATDVLLAFAGRKQHHGIYHLLVLIGSLQRPLDDLLLQIAGYWLVWRMLEKWRPSDGALAKLVAALSRPTGKRAKGWTAHARAKALHRARRGMEEARAANPRVAVALGIDGRAGPQANEMSKERAFNDAFRRRWNDLTNYYTRAQAAGAFRNGTLAPVGLADVGAELANLMRIGDAAALHVALEVETFLPSELLDDLLIVTKQAEAPDVLAWVDLPNRSYNRRLWWTDEKGARPDQITNDLYEVTMQVCRTAMSPVVIESLSRFVKADTPPVCSVIELLGPVSHHPRARVAGKGRYKCTASRLQHSLPAAVLDLGHYRWPTVLAVSAPFVVAAGRRSYGACRGRFIQAAANARYEALCWPVPKELGGDELVGGFVTPRVQSICIAFQFLAEVADQTDIRTSTFSGLVDCLNEHAAWVAFALALCLALRGCDPYPLPSKPLQHGESIGFNDKDIHEYKSPSVPKARLLQRAVSAWVALCRRASERLGAMEDPAAVALHRLIKARLDGEAGPGLVFTVDATYQLIPASYHTWQQALPARLKLVSNFGRHFWPLHLQDLGIEQLAIDILLRHQFGDLHAGASDNTRVPGAVRRRLVAALDAMIERIDVRVPLLLECKA